MIRCLAIDDEPLALQQLTAYIKKIPFLELVDSCQSAHDALTVMNQEVIDAIFVDINMPDLNGMDFVKSLPVPPLVVFTTAYSEYAVEGFKVDAVDYLLKPFGLTDFQRAANKVKARYDQQNTAVIAQDEEDTLFLKTDYKVIRIDMKDIRYVQSMSEYLKIFLEGRAKPVIVLLSMKKMEERLPENQFMRIHRGYIINLKKIQEVNKNRVIMDEETYLPIGDNYKEAFNSYLESKFLGK
ncbi:MAG: response regulator transcription factor [Prevotella sp.]|nr:response regulator transcription factor [Prevotella sp.]MBQ3827952.1 response regulator transcription factor [Prevotella sp.]MBQ4147829.1 response regulator transcription factor [Prevotella sp.]MBQ9571696.1 response regulator transcription factor [Prevotella sp.]